MAMPSPLLTGAVVAGGAPPSVRGTAAAAHR
jgi:hypothetical protein